VRPVESVPPISYFVPLEGRFVVASLERREGDGRGTNEVGVEQIRLYAAVRRQAATGSEPGEGLTRERSLARSPPRRRELPLVTARKVGGGATYKGQRTHSHPAQPHAIFRGPAENRPDSAQRAEPTDPAASHTRGRAGQAGRSAMTFCVDWGDFR